MELTDIQGDAHDHLSEMVYELTDESTRNFIEVQYGSVSGYIDTVFEHIKEDLQDLKVEAEDQVPSCGRCGGSGGAPPEHPCPRCGGSGRP